MPILDLVLSNVQALVNHPGSVCVFLDGESIIITVQPGDERHVVGKGGRTIDALKTLVRAWAGKERRHLSLELRD